MPVLTLTPIAPVSSTLAAKSPTGLTLAAKASTTLTLTVNTPAVLPSVSLYPSSSLYPSAGSSYGPTVLTSLSPTTLVLT